MIAGDLPDIPGYMKVDSLKVHAPTAVVVVCGGRAPLDFNQPIQSLRDAFMRISDRPSLSKFDIRLAEDLVQLPRPGYDNLLQLESDISQISALIMLFAESPGSLAELGIFVMDDEVLPRLMVIVDKFNYAKDSFIRRGVLDYVSDTISEQSVCVIDLTDHGSNVIEAVSDLDVDSFEKFIEGKVSDRMSVSPPPRTFSPSKSGHLIKLLTGLIQNYASLTIDEIDFLLWCIGIKSTDIRIKSLLGCAELFGWITVEKSGTHTYYSSTGGAIAVQFEVSEDAPKVNKAKWRSDVRQYWKENDPDRFKCIASASGDKQ